MPRRAGLAARPAFRRSVGERLGPHLLGTALCRYILQLPPIVAMDADTQVASVAPLLQHLLTGSLAGDRT
ncbi:MAG: hypothetical protein ACRDRO_31090 [Pseudonocardiaceae bacterium]